LGVSRRQEQFIDQRPAIIVEPPSTTSGFPQQPLHQ